MEPARVRFLEEGRSLSFLSGQSAATAVETEKKQWITYPYTLTRVDGVLTGILQAERTAVLTAD